MESKSSCGTGQRSTGVFVKDIKIWWTCECGHEFEIGVSPIIPAQLSGPPENCYPAEGGEVDTSECPKCGKEINENIAQDMADEKARDVADDAADHDYQEWKDSRL